MSEMLSPQQLTSEAMSAYKQGDYLAAAKSYDAAANSFVLEGDKLSAAEMRNNSSVAYLKSGDGQSALDVVQGTEMVFAEAGDIRRQGIALGNIGAAYESLDRLEEAEQAYLQSAELLATIGEKDLRAHVMQSISALQLRTGRQLQALATMQAGVEGIDRPNPRQRLLKKILQLPNKFLGTG